MCHVAISCNVPTIAELIREALRLRMNVTPEGLEVVYFFLFALILNDKQNVSVISKLLQHCKDTYILLIERKDPFPDVLRGCLWGVRSVLSKYLMVCILDH
jgi:hypothetical protein